MPQANQTRETEPLQLGPFPKGMNNMARDYALPEGFVRDALNVDQDLTGHFRLRDGTTKVVSCTLPTAFLEGDYLYYAADGSIYQAVVTAGNLVSTQLSGTASIGAKVCFCRTPLKLLASDTLRIYEIIGTSFMPLVVPITFDNIRNNMKTGEYLAQLPGGKKLIMHGARLYSVLGNSINYSDPYDYYRYRPLTNAYRFDSEVKVCESLATGMLIGAEKLYFLPGMDPTSAEMKVLSDDQAIGSKRVKDGAYVVLKNYGLVFVDDQGLIKYLQQSVVAIPESSYSNVSIVERDGDRAVLFDLDNSAGSSMAARSYMDITVYKGP